MKTFLAALLVLLSSLAVNAATERMIELWPEGAPGAVGKEKSDIPTLTIYLPENGKVTGAGIVVCPGGGYRGLAIDHEGAQVARFLNKHGIAAFVLRYRLAPRYEHPAPLQDAQRAIRYVRANASELGVVSHRLGILGFSAGGHLASTAATHFDSGRRDATDAVEKQSSRPDFVVLGYPVLTMDDQYVHKGSRQALLGDNPDPALQESLSNEKQVTRDTPPAFILHTDEDSGVVPENSVLFYQALRKAKVPAELHIFAFGPHGIGLATGDPAAGKWPELMVNWLRRSGFLTDGKRQAVNGSVQYHGKPLYRGWVKLIPTGEGAHGKPIASAFFSNGKFRIAEKDGPVAGKHKVEIYALANAFLEVPSVEDSKRFEVGEREIKAGDNILDLGVGD